MVVCKFFQEGYCRYGQNCRFEHIYGSKYTYHSGQANAPTQQQHSGGVTDEQLVQQVQSDVQSALKGGQWVLSCYSPFKDKPFPGISDLSPEEARLFIYEAKANNNVDQAVAYMNNLTTEARRKYEQLLNPSPSILQVLRALYKGESPASPFTNSQHNTNSNASSIFRSATQNMSPFSQNTTSIFNQAPTNVFNQQNTAAKSIFAQANQNVFNQQQQQPQTNTFFSPTEDKAKSVFAQANIWGSPSTTANQNAPMQNRSPFEQSSAPATQHRSPFEQPSPFAQPTNVFQKSEPANIFAQAVNVFEQKSTVDDSSVYSNDNDLTPDDMEAFSADNFKLGFIPELPPPKSLCH